MNWRQIAGACNLLMRTVGRRSIKKVELQVDPVVFSCVVPASLCLANRVIRIPVRLSLVASVGILRFPVNSEI
jgi:hypothetical protein